MRGITFRSYVAFIAFLSAATTAGARPAQLPDVDTLIAQAGKACSAMVPDKTNSAQRRQAWMRLAQARANNGDIAGAIQALNNCNADPDFSECSAYVMQLEATGVLPPEPENVRAEVLAGHRAGIIHVLITLGEYDKAIEEATRSAAGPAKSLAIAETCVAIADAQSKEDRYEAALANYLKAMQADNDFPNVRKKLHWLDEICSGLVSCGFEMGAAPVANNIEDLLKQAEEKMNNPGFVAQRWLQTGRLWLLMQDEALAQKAFDRAEVLYTQFGQASTGIP